MTFISLSRAMAAAAVAMVAIAGSSVPAHAGLQDENLLMPLPAGFKVGWEVSNASLSQRELIPAAETVDDWSTMITMQTFHGSFNVTPDDFAQNLIKGVSDVCPGTESQKVVDGTENGYAFSIWVVSCPLNPQTQKPESFYIKTIHGDDAIYDVQYAFRKAVTIALSEPAIRYLQKISVCDSRRADRPCPAGM